MSAETTPTDLSDRTWEELYDADYSILRELAKNVDGVRGDGSREEICVGLFEYAGRADDVPEEYRDHLDGEVPEGDTDDDESEATDDEGEDYSTTDAPARGASFIVEAGVLQEWLEYPKALVEEAKVHLNRNQLRIRAVDPASVGMVDTTLNDGAFESFDVAREGVIGVNLKRVEGVVNRAGKGDLLHLDYNAERQNLVIRWGGHEFTISLIDPESIRREPDIPNLNLDNEIVVSEASTLQAAVSFSEDVSDHVNFEVREGVFFIEATGDTDSYEGKFEDDDEIEFVKPPVEVNSLFSLDYLGDMAKTFGGDEEVTVKLGQEYPTHLEAPVPYDDGAVGQVLFMLAPRIQSE